MSTKYTRMPWRVAGTGDRIRATGVLGEIVGQGNLALDAAHIVKCVNAHDELIAALTQLLSEVDHAIDRGGSWVGDGGRVMALAAIAKAQSS